MEKIKKILILLLMVLIVLPTTAFAEEKTYTTLNLDEALTEEEIDHDFSNYKETDDQITIYLFRGKGCGYCKKFLTFLNSIIDDYGKYFKVESYEVWNNTDNAQLMSDVAKALGKKAGGVPFIVIGDKVFAGYAESYDKDIKAAIKELYETKKEDRYDVMKEYTKGSGSKVEEKDTDSTFVGIIVYSTIIALGTSLAVFFYERSKRIALEERIISLESKKYKK